MNDDLSLNHSPDGNTMWYGSPNTEERPYMASSRSILGRRLSNWHVAENARFSRGI
jgi:hypothetical protein